MSEDEASLGSDSDSDSDDPNDDDDNTGNSGDDNDDIKQSEHKNKVNAHHTLILEE